LNLDIIVKIAKSQYGNAGKYMAIFDVNKPMLRNPNKRVQSFLFCLPSGAGKPGLLKDAGVTLIRGKTIQIARALLVTAGSEGSDRK
jgi:hypothetical protein